MVASQPVAVCSTLPCVFHSHTVDLLVSFRFAKNRPLLSLPFFVLIIKQAFLVNPLHQRVPYILLTLLIICRAGKRKGSRVTFEELLSTVKRLYFGRLQRSTYINISPPTFYILKHRRQQLIMLLPHLPPTAHVGGPGVTSRYLFSADATP